MKKTKQYLVYCEYDYYCQGTESTYGYFLVEATHWEDACNKVRARVDNARNFVNKNIE